MYKPTDRKPLFTTATFIFWYIHLLWKVYVVTYVSAKENAFPWIVALIRDEDKSEDYISTSCSGTLVGFTVDPLIFISHRSGAPGWSQQPTVSTKMTNFWLQSPSQSFLDFTTETKRRSLKGALGNFSFEPLFFSQEASQGWSNLCPWKLHFHRQQSKRHSATSSRWNFVSSFMQIFLAEY